MTPKFEKGREVYGKSCLFSLIDENADVNLKYFWKTTDDTALSLAEETGNKEIISMLKKAGATK